MLEADNLINYDFERHYKTRREVSVEQIKRWFKEWMISL